MNVIKKKTNYQPTGDILDEIRTFFVNFFYIKTKGANNIKIFYGQRLYLTSTF